MNLYKPPGVSESIDWAMALERIGNSDLTEDGITATIRALKYREDQQEIMEYGLDKVIEDAARRSDIHKDINKPEYITRIYHLS